MNERTEIFFKIVIITIFFAIIISFFKEQLININADYGSFFLFGGALVSFLYEFFKMIRNKPEKQTKK